MSYYDDLRGRNVIKLMEHLLKQGVLSMRGSDGKFIANLSIEWKTPWIHNKSSYITNCFWWKEITFHNIVEKQFPRDRWFVPVGCQDCFKVVVRPKTLKQLFELERLQFDLNHPSKCGIEVRQSVNANYGGYFYNRGLQEGLENYKLVREAVNDCISPDVGVILKRGCTELEHGVGPSDKWQITKEQIDFEMRLSQLFVNDIPVLSQSDHAKDAVRQRWIEYAYGIADETVFEFTDGKPLYPNYVTYHHLVDEMEDK
jgi:hypothetical protein